MPPKVNQKIIQKLKQSADAGLTYYQAKQNLLDNGYNDKDIELASYEYQYGHKPAKHEPSPMELALEKHTEIADKIANAIIKEDNETVQHKPY